MNLLKLISILTGLLALGLTTKPKLQSVPPAGTGDDIRYDTEDFLGDLSD